MSENRHELTRHERRLLIECMDTKIKEAYGRITYGLKSLMSPDDRTRAYAWDRAVTGARTLPRLLTLYRKLIPDGMEEAMANIDTTIPAFVMATGPGPLWNDEDEKRKKELINER